MSSRPYVLAQLEPYIYIQSVDSSDVLITHNKNKLAPKVILISTDGDEIEAQIKYVDVNTVRILLNMPIQFTAYIY
jgi:putative aminopeptidase FrvX